MKLFPAVRIRQFINYPPYLLEWILRHFVYKKSSFKFNNKFENLKQFTDNETLEYIINNNKSIIRFGDGEFQLLTGAGIFSGYLGGLRFKWSQEYSKELKKEMIEGLSSVEKNILVAIPPVWQIIYNDKFSEMKSYKEKIYSNMHIEARMHAWKYLNQNVIYGSWCVFMPQHHENMNWNLIYEYFKGKNIVIVTGKIENLSHIKLGQETFFIECGIKNNAFEKRLEIFDKIDQNIKINNLQKENTLFLISMGPTAISIVNYLSKKDFVAWDTGSLFEHAFLEMQKFLLK